MDRQTNEGGRKNKHKKEIEIDRSKETKIGCELWLENMYLGTTGWINSKSKRVLLSWHGPITTTANSALVKYYETLKSKNR